ncbi:MAG TPA: DUF1254 domain-containing protein, partial [Myxococcota bacterium]|nr:DUF1254 domain-containing protein [Myxococcota bacterium]
MRWLVGVLLGAVVVHFAAIAALPYAIMRVAMSRMQRAATNDLAHGPLPTAESRGIVRPSPDLAYSALVFDVSERALEVRVPLTPPYTSLSGFAANTDNFFAINDRTAGASEIEIVLVGPGTPRSDFGGARVVEAPSDRGILLVRRVVPSPEAFAEIDEARRRARVKPLP